MQKIYFVLWLISIIPNFFILTKTGLKWYSIFNCLHPIVILLAIFRAISVKANNWERSVGNTSTSGARLTGDIDMSDLSNLSSMIDDKSVLSEHRLDNGGSSNFTLRQIDGTAYSDADLN